MFQYLMICRSKLNDILMLIRTIKKAINENRKSGTCECLEKFIVKTVVELK